MRKLMWLSIGFAAGCALCAYGSAGFWKASAVILACLGAAVLAGEKLGQRRCWIGAIAGFLAGAGWFALYSFSVLSPLKPLDDTAGHYTVTIADYSRATDYGASADGRITIHDREYSARIYFREETLLEPGDQVTGSFRLKLTLPEPGEDNFYNPGKGIFLLLYPQEDLIVTAGQGMRLSLYPSVLRGNIRDTLARCFTGEYSGFAKALLLGDTSELTYARDTDFSISGIRHIVAVSGLHISILYGLIALVAFRQRHLTAVIGITVLLLFAAVAGFTPSVNRACVMIFFLLLARIFNREYDPPTALAAAVFLMLLGNPWVVTSVSLQLSALCVAGILLFQGRIDRWLRSHLPNRKGFLGKLQKGICSAIAVSVSAQSLVMPLSAWHFGAVSVIGVVTNVLTLWLVNLAFNGLVVVVALNGLAPGAAGFLAGIVEWLMGGVLFAAEKLADLPLAAVFTRSPYITGWLVFLYILLIVFLLQKEKQPAVLICCGCLGLCIALLASWAEPMLDDARITMLDVGQGQSILLQTEGRTYLVDCGGDDDEETADIVAETLLSQGVSRLDGIILTHFDRDHAGGAANLMSRMDTELLILPDVGVVFPAPETGEKRLYVSEDICLTFGSARMTIFAPHYSGDDNENSLCVLFDTKKCDILITGDRSQTGERMLLRHAALPDVDVLVAGHHGAASSTCQELLSVVTPEIVLISVGADNIYGHPAPALLQRLEASGCQVYRTDLNGTIIIRR